MKGGIVATPSSLSRTFAGRNSVGETSSYFAQWHTGYPSFNAEPLAATKVG
jgi:hypothetical protein